MSAVPEKVDILIVAENPTQIDDTHGRIFHGKGLGEIAKFFDDTGLTVHCTYATRCVKPGKHFKIKDSHIKACANNYLREEIKACQPEHIIVLGGSALYGATGTKGISEKVGNRYYDEKIEAWIYPTVHQAQAAYDDMQKKVLWDNLGLFKRWIMGETVEGAELTKFEPPVYEINSLKKLREMAAKIEAADFVVAIDTETTGLNPYTTTGEIRTIQFCWDADYGGCYIPLNIGDGCYWQVSGRQMRLPMEELPRYLRPVVKQIKANNPDKDEWEENGSWRCDAATYWTDEEWPEVGRILRDLLAKCKCIWHNGKFDRLWLHLWGQRAFGYPLLCPKILMDTMHVAHMLDENRLVKLKKLITQELGYPTYDIPDKLTKNVALLFPYAAKDTVASFLLAQKYSELMHDPDNAKLAKLYTKVTRRMDALFTKIELRGWPVHEQEAARVLEDLTLKMDGIQTRMLDYLEEAGLTEVTWKGPTGKESTTPVTAKTFSSVYQLAPLLFDQLKLPLHSEKIIAYTESGGRSTKEDALIHVKQHPFVSLLLDWRGLSKAISTYALPMLVAARTRGRLTTSYKLTGTATGRTASGKEGSAKGARGGQKVVVEVGGRIYKTQVGGGMNLQNIPHDERDIFDDEGVLMRSALVKGIRDIIRPADDDPYDTIVEVDFSQIEIRIAGELSQDPFILRAYRENRDLHMLRGMRLLHTDEHNWDVLEEHFKILKKTDPGKAKAVRQNAKPVNFGFLYGMGAAKFKQFALTDYDIDLTMSECVNIRKGFFSDHSGLSAWYQHTERTAVRSGYVESLSGRRRHLPNMKLDADSSGDAKKKYTEALRQAINTPVQGFASDMKLMAMIEIDDKLPEEWGYIIGEVHDSIVLQCKKEFAQAVIDLCVAIMRRPSILAQLGVQLTIPIDAEGKMGPSLGKAH